MRHLGSLSVCRFRVNGGCVEGLDEDANAIPHACLDRGGTLRPREGLVQQRSTHVASASTSSSFSARAIYAPWSASTSRITTRCETIRGWPASSSCRPPTSTSRDRSSAESASADFSASTTGKRPETPRSSFCTLRGRVDESCTRSSQTDTRSHQRNPRVGYPRIRFSFSPLHAANVRASVARPPSHS